jgi:hypothetical protein
MSPRQIGLTRRILLHKAGGSGSEHLDDLCGHVYVGSPYVQRGHGISSFLAGLFRSLKPLTIRGARALGCEALHTGAQILPDIGNKQPETKFKDIVADRLAESALRLVTKLKGDGGRKRKREHLTFFLRRRRRRIKRMLHLRRGGKVQKAMYSPNRSHSTSGRTGLHNNKMRVRFIRQEARADGGSIVTSHTLQTHLAGGSIRTPVHHTWR